MRRDPTLQAVATESVVLAFRIAGLFLFAVIGWFIPPSRAVSTNLLYLSILVGMVYSLYTFHALYSGAFVRRLPHSMVLFLACDIALVFSLAYFANLFREGLYCFYVFLLLVVALRANFRSSLVIGPLTVLAYYFSFHLLSPSRAVTLSRFSLEAAGLLVIAATAGWFAERRPRAWRVLERMARKFLGRDSAVSLEEARRELEILRRLQETQRDFLAIVSHELRTPLTGIIGYSDLLLLGEVGRLEERQREYVSGILGRSIDLLNLIDNILHINQIQSGRWGFALKRVSPDQLIGEATDTILPEARKKRIALEVARHPGERCPDILADGEKVRLVLLNLLANAIRHTPAGGTVRVDHDIIADNFLEEHFPHLISSTQAVRFSVSDSGPGVSPADKPRIFDLFFHGKNTEGDPSASRMGMGLAVAKELIEHHWGRIWYDDAAGGGSRFSFTLPVSPLRVMNRIALQKTYFNLVLLLEGLLLQFDEELARKQLTVAREGWPADGDTSCVVCADRQLLQSVFFNVLNNKIRYAFPGSELSISIDPAARSRYFLVEVVSRGETMKSSLIEGLNRGDAVGDHGSSDLRNVHVNLDLARDIIESHSGVFQLQVLGNHETAVTIFLPRVEETAGKGAADEVA